MILQIELCTFNKLSINFASRQHILRVQVWNTSRKIRFVCHSVEQEYEEPDSENSEKPFQKEILIQNGMIRKIERLV